jgi:histone H3/H4
MSAKTKATKKTVGQIEKEEATPAVPAKKTAAKVASAKKASPEGKRKRRANYSSLSSYTYKALKEVHPDQGIKKDASEMVNRLIDEYLRSVARRTSELLADARRKTVEQKTIVAAVQLALPPGIAEHAIEAGNAALDRYQSAKGKPSPQSDEKKAHVAKRSFRAGIVYPITRIQNRFKTMLTLQGKRMSANAAVFLVATVDDLAHSILELAGNEATEAKKTRINSRHLLLALRRDAEFNEIITGGRFVMQGGVVPEPKPPKKGEEAEEEAAAA